jgi:hypothetical protein
VSRWAKKVEKVSRTATDATDGRCENAKSHGALSLVALSGIHATSPSAEEMAVARGLLWAVLMGRAGLTFCLSDGTSCAVAQGANLCLAWWVGPLPRGGLPCPQLTEIAPLPNPQVPKRRRLYHGVGLSSPCLPRARIRRLLPHSPKQ